ncbi:MAG: hypothetical protein AMJ90_08000 [candidate division Zixibacteria bacterium SM23_73_2]|nr:MAG: hypothetical protein AMJ90_08000 [candidate division Zixibacteria bacterium SM23_73_2]
MDQQDKIAKSTGVVSSSIMLSRILGLVREQVFAYLFGAGLYTDAFVAAFRIPNLLRELFAEGVMATSFIPVFTDHLTNQGKDKAFHLANLMINLLLVVLSIIIIIGVFVSPFLAELIAPGFNQIPGKLELTTHLAQIMFPFLLLVSLAAVAMGILHSFGHFATPALAPTLFNTGMIFSGFFICPLFDPPIIGMAIGALLGGFGQLIIQIPRVRKYGFSYKPVLNLSDPGVKRILLLMIPAIFGVASTQINIFVTTHLASLLPQGSVSYLNYSYRLMQLPLGVFGVAVATVTLPAISLQVAQKEMKKVVSTLCSSLKLVLYLVIPSSVFLIVGAEPIISVIYQYGKFTYLDTQATAYALVLYAFGLFTFAVVRVTAPIFYTLGDAKTPVKVSAISVVVNIILNLILMGPLGYKGLALANSLAGVVNMSLLLLFIDKKIGPLKRKDLTFSSFKYLLASLFMGVVIYSILYLFKLDLEIASLKQKISLLAGLLVSGFLSYLTASLVLKVGELKRIFDILKIFKGK